MAYACIALAFLTGWMLNRTGFGLQIRACGESPKAARGRRAVARIRVICVVFGGVMDGLGGAYLAIAQIDAFVESMVALITVGKKTPSPMRKIAGALPMPKKDQ
jgi:ABC-type uncharacterized transport system permease subunit